MLIESAGYLGDVAENATITFFWNTKGADGASITRSTDGSISVYKDDSDTEITAGITDDEDADGKTGVHRCVIVLTDAAYSIGSDYNVVLGGSVVDTKTVNAPIASFSIQNRYQPFTLTQIRTQVDDGLVAIHLDHLLLASTVSDATPGASVFETALTEISNDHYNDSIIFFISGNLANQGRRISDYVGSSKEITVSPSFTEAPGDGDAFLIMTSIYLKDPAIDGIDSRTEHIDHLFISSTVNDVTPATDSFDTNLTEASDDHHNDSIIFFVGASPLANQARRISDYIGSSKNITVTPPFTEAPANGDEFLICPAFYLKDLLIDGVNSRTSDIDHLFLSAEVDDVSASTTVFITDLTEASDDHYNDSILFFVSGNLANQGRRILDYDGTTKTVTLATALTEAPANGDEFLVVPAIFLRDTQIEDIKERTDRLQYDSSDYVRSVQVYPTGVVVAGGGNTKTQFKTDLTETETDAWRGSMLQFTSGTNNKEVRKIDVYNGSTNVLRLTIPFSSIPSPGDNFKLINE